MTWIDGLLIVTLALLAGYALYSRVESKAWAQVTSDLREDLRIEREGRAADRAQAEEARREERTLFNDEREVHLFDHRQLLARQVLKQGMPPLDKSLETTEDRPEEFDEETEEGVRARLEQMEGGRVRGAGRVQQTREEYDRLQTKLETIRARRRSAEPGTPRHQDASPYDTDETPLTSDDYAAIDEAAH